MPDYFRGNPDGQDPMEFLADREPIRPEYRDRDARLAVWTSRASKRSGSSRPSA